MTENIRATALSQPDSAPLAPVVEELRELLTRRKTAAAQGLEGTMLAIDLSMAQKVPALLSHIDAGGKEDGTHTHGLTPASEDITGKWRPIDTAPKDERLVLLYDHIDKDVFIGSWDLNTDWRHEPGGWPLAPTHWMPLPEPPEMGAQAHRAGASP